jgi:hypothetical protein
MADLVDTTQKHLRHKDGRLRRCVEGEIIQDGWSRALADARPCPGRAALDDYKRRNTCAWQSPDQRATSDLRATSAVPSR